MDQVKRCLIRVKEYYSEKEILVYLCTLKNFFGTYNLISEKNYAVKYFENCMYKMDMLYYMVPIEPYNIYLNELSLKSSFTKLSEFLLCVPSCVVSVCRE